MLDQGKISSACGQFVQMTVPVLPPTGRGLDEEGGSSYCPLLEYTDSCSWSPVETYPAELRPCLDKTNRASVLIRVQPPDLDLVLFGLTLTSATGPGQMWETFQALRISMERVRGK